jgi:hypothetical protein
MQDKSVAGGHSLVYTGSGQDGDAGQVKGANITGCAI